MNYCDECGASRPAHTHMGQHGELFLCDNCIYDHWKEGKRSKGLGNYERRLIWTTA